MKKCAACGSADTQTGLDQQDCLACGAGTRMGEVVRLPERPGVTTTDRGDEVA